MLEDRYVVRLLGVLCDTLWRQAVPPTYSYSTYNAAMGVLQNVAVISGFFFYKYWGYKQGL